MSFVTCPFCNRSFHCPDDPTRTSARCTHCGDRVQIEWDHRGQPSVDLEEPPFVDEADEPHGDYYEDYGMSAATKGLLLGLGVGAGTVLVGVIIVLLLLGAPGQAPLPVAQNTPAPVIAQPEVAVPVNSNAATNPVVTSVQPAQPETVATAPLPKPDAPATGSTMPPVAGLTPAPVAPMPVAPVPVAPKEAPAPAPFVAAVPPVPVKAEPANSLRYKFEPNREYPYKFSIEANLGNSTTSTTGTLIYRVSKQTAPPTIEVKREGSGSAFVVAADGYLVTCAHVVDKAKTIEVVIAGKTYFASVISSDPLRDVALIRIDAQNLTPVALADGDAAQLGQSVKALGFPLSDVLGENLKVTSGTISGLNQQAGVRTLQIDAAINPGNSGGPVVNEHGEVIGVASAKLSGVAVSTVGFARPIADAKTLLEQAQVKFVTVEKPEKLDGPALAAKLSPSVAFVRVRSGGTGNRIVLDYEVNFTTKQRQQAGVFAGPDFNFPSSSRGSGLLVIDEFGTILHTTGEQQLPMTLGPAALMGVMPLNPSGQATWGSSEPTSISKIERDRNDPFGRLRPPIPFFGGPLRQENVTVIPAHETVSFKLGQLDADTRIVQRQYDLRTTDNVETPYLALKGSGEWRFDIKDSKPLGAELKYELARHTDNATLRMPFVVKIDFTDPKVIETERKAEEDRMAAFRVEQSRKAADDLDLVAKPKVAKLKQRFAPLSSLIVGAVQLSPDGRRCFVATQEGPIHVYDTQQKEPVGKLEGIEGMADTIVMSLDGKRIAALSHKTTCIWDVETSEIVLKPTMKLRPASMVFSPDGRRMYFGLHGMMLEVWDLEGKQKLKEWRNGTRSGVGTPFALAVSPDGSELLETDGKSARWWNPETATELRSVSLSKDNELRDPCRICFATSLGIARKTSSTLVVINFKDPNEQRTLPFRAPNQAREWALSSDGKRLAMSDQGNSKNVVVWDIETNQLVESWQVDTISSQAVSLSADGKLLMTSGYHKVLQLWELP